MRTNDPNCLGLIALTGIIVGIMLPPISSCMTSGEYKKAEPIAIQEFGDKRAPLSELEKDEWYKVMGVKEGKEPDFKQLRQYRKERANN